MLNLGVLSTSRIVAEFFDHLAEMPEVAVTALCCRPQSAAKAQGWAAVHGGFAVYTDEAAFYAEKPFDAVYIGTANHLHYAAAKRALAAGVSVILEKPFTATAAQARELYALADANGLFLLEAITIPYLPGYAFLRQQLPAIGPVRGAMAAFCARSRRYDDYLAGIWNPTFDPACNGGALNDMNVYNLHFLVGLLGAPQGCAYHASRGPNGIDTAGLATLDYGGFTAACFAAKDSQGENGVVIQGPGGHLTLRGTPNSMEGELYAELGAGRTSNTRTPGPQNARHRMAYEFAEFARIIAGRDRAAEAAARRQTLAVMDLLDALHADDPAPLG